VVPLPEMAWRIIEPRLTNSKWIFPSFHDATRVGAKGDGHSKCTKDARRRLRKVTGIDNWTAHDLRRTCRTITPGDIQKILVFSEKLALPG